MDEGQDTSCVRTCVCARESRDELASPRQEKNRRKALRGAASGCGGGDNKEVCLFLFFLHLPFPTRLAEEDIFIGLAHMAQKRNKFICKDTRGSPVEDEISA